MGIGLGWSSETAERLLEYSKKHKYGWRQIFDSSKNGSEVFGIVGVPQVCLIDEEGIVLVSTEGGRIKGLKKVEKILEERLGEEEEERKED